MSCMSGWGALLTLMYRGAVLLAAEAPLARVPQCLRISLKMHRCQCSL